MGSMHSHSPRPRPPAALILKASSQVHRRHPKSRKKHTHTQTWGTQQNKQHTRSLSVFTLPLFSFSINIVFLLFFIVWFAAFSVRWKRGTFALWVDWWIEVNNWKGGVGSWSLRMLKTGRGGGSPPRFQARAWTALWRRWFPRARHNLQVSYLDLKIREVDIVCEHPCSLSVYSTIAAENSRPWVAVVFGMGTSQNSQSCSFNNDVWVLKAIFTSSPEH